jgi:hypothetical protein
MMLFRIIVIIFARIFTILKMFLRFFDHSQSVRIGDIKHYLRLSTSNNINLGK